jgi:SAM-dependent methyltransferase
VTKSDLIGDIAGYYTTALRRHGATPRGVDWNGDESQRLRFHELSRVIDADGGFSLNDLGCGYGAYYDYLVEAFGSVQYFGFDVSEAMVESARARLTAEGCRLKVASTPDVESDFGVASGIFNVRLGREDAEWEAYIHATLDTLHETSRKGFAFNCLTSYSDTDKMRDYLYYANPGALFDHCKRRYARNVALLHDYGLWEFTILVRKNV